MLWLFQTSWKTSMKLGVLSFKTSHCQQNFCSFLYTIIHYLLKENITGIVPVSETHCQYCNPPISSMTIVSTWHQLNHHVVYLDRLSSNRCHLVLLTCFAAKTLVLERGISLSINTFPPYFAQSDDRKSCNAHCYMSKWKWSSIFVA